MMGLVVVYCKKLALLGKQMMLNGERGQRRLVKAAQDELFLAGIGVDVADRRRFPERWSGISRYPP